MKKKGMRCLECGCMLMVLFVVWTVLIQCVDVQAIGPQSTEVGFSELNSWFHTLTGVHMIFYVITDWLGLVPIFVCMLFGCIGMAQLVKKKKIARVDYDIIILGIYYVFVIFGYLVFEMFPINYRPILIEGVLETSYPSSTTLLVICVMPTLVEQVNRRCSNELVKKATSIFVTVFCVP